MTTKTLTFGLLLSTLFATSASAQMKIERLAHDNCNIRVAASEQSKYLLLPIEDKAPEANIRVIANNDLQRTINVRLAQNKVDYYVPFLLDEFRGKELVLSATLNIDRSNRGGVGADVRLKDIRLSDTFDSSNKEKFRPAFHHTPEYAWMNDPNGMFYLDGVWHLFYQYNPYGSMWGNMNWGHSTSTDLINWKHEPIALAPDAHGTIFSGSCVVDKDGTAGFGKGAVIALYTSATATPRGDIQFQSLAYSTDGGHTFKKYEGNPILTADIADFRDPNMFWNEDIKAWNLIMSAGQEMRIYSSPNLKDWHEESRFGLNLGCHGGVWECPDLMKLPVEGSKESKWVLIGNINPGFIFGGSATQYFVGDFDGHKFTVDDEARYQNGNALWQDYGKDHYATVSFSNAPDGRHPMIAWMSNWEYANDVPTMQYRSSNSIVRDAYLYKVGKDYFLGSRPAPEYNNAGLDKTVKVKGSCTIKLSNAEGDEAVIIYDQKAMTLTFDRSKCGQTDFSQNFATKTTAPVHRKLTSIRIFIDNSSVEVFGNNGEVVLTNLVFPKSPLTIMK
ncbi:MAG: DUF4980 domain-containing protein [Bacteroidaceae bacterium]|nr:DUF4980 domain-containing protein [Bacteroidaceae bacterium]